MIPFTIAAIAQIDDLLRFYLVEKDRPEAARRLREDLADAMRLIRSNPDGGVPAPGPYPHLSAYGFRWLRARAYWVSWKVMDGTPVITNVCHVSADIERRATPEADGVSEW